MLSSAATAKKCTKKRYAREELFFCFICYPTAFVLLSLPSPSSLYKLPNNYSWLKKTLVLELAQSLLITFETEVDYSVSSLSRHQK